MPCRIFALLDSNTSKPMLLMMERTHGSMILDALSISATMPHASKLCPHVAKCLLYESQMERQLLHLESAPLFFACETNMENTNDSYWRMWHSYQKCPIHCCHQSDCGKHIVLKQNLVVLVSLRHSMVPVSRFPLARMTILSRQRLLRMHTSVSSTQSLSMCHLCCFIDDLHTLDMHACVQQDYVLLVYHHSRTMWSIHFVTAVPKGPMSMYLLPRTSQGIRYNWSFWIRILLILYGS